MIAKNENITIIIDDVGRQLRKTADELSDVAFTRAYKFDDEETYNSIMPIVDNINESNGVIEDICRLLDYLRDNGMSPNI